MLGKQIPQSLKVETQEAKDFYTTTGNNKNLIIFIVIIKFLITRICPISKTKEKK